MHFEATTPRQWSGRSPGIACSCRCRRCARQLQAELNERQATVAYAESFFAASVLMERISAVGIAQLLQDLDAGQSIDQAVERFGFTLADFESKLARRVGVTLTAARSQQ